MSDPLEIADPVHVCPTCGEAHDAFVMASDLPLSAREIRCAQRGCNFLRVCSAAAPSLFGLTFGKLDRLAVLLVRRCTRFCWFDFSSPAALFQHGMSSSNAAIRGRNLWSV